MAALTSSQRRHILFLVLIIALVEYHNNIRERCALLRPAILHPTRSPWRRLMDYGDASSFLLLTGITREAFYILLDILLPPRPEHLPKRRGRKWSLPPDGQLGLLLFYLGSTMSRMINNMLVIVNRRLRFHPLSRVKFPDDGKMQQFASMVQQREPSVDNVIGFMDGVSFTSECTDDKTIQNAFYCGYDCDTMVNNIIAYGPDGKVFFCGLNFPGSWADGSVTARFLPYIVQRIGNYKICVDQGFPRSGLAQDILVGPIPPRSARHLHRDVSDYIIPVSNVYTSLRQASEWGMRGLQGSFPRCKKRLPIDSFTRRLVLEAIIFIHNFRTELVGSNQIQSVFDPEYERVITLEGYDRISQYYLQPGEYETDNDSDND